MTLPVSLLQQMFAIALLLVSSCFIFSDTEAAERTHPFQIGALTTSWGPTPMIVGMRDGLLELGYRENEDFFLGVRFTQGNIEALSTAARGILPREDDRSPRCQSPSVPLFQIFQRGKHRFPWTIA